jgi:hypothetical protein
MEIGGLEQELLVEETKALLGQLTNGAHRAQYLALLEGLQAGDVPEPALDPLAALLEMGLQTGRLKRRYTAEGEQALLRIYHKTPQGAAVVKSTNETNRALEALVGQVVQSIAFSARSPGVYGLTLETDQGHFSLRIQREGVWLDNVEIDM